MRFQFFLFVMTIFAGFLISLSEPADAQYISKNVVLTTGQPVKIAINDAKILTIIYHPGGNTSSKRQLRVQPPNYDWTPSRAGLYVLSTPGGPSQTVSVRFRSFPIKGLIILLIAFVVLFGGAGFASYHVFSRN
jgi:hypothetical protein